MNKTKIKGVDIRTKRSERESIRRDEHVSASAASVAKSKRKRM